jgi:thioester reductase-like protein
MRRVVGPAAAVAQPPLRMSRTLLTGATGFLGMELLARYLERSDREVVLLVRARDDLEAGARVDGVLRNLFGSGGSRYRSRVTAVAAELTEPRLGLSERDHDALAADLDEIVHSAASVTFDLPLADARAVNVEGTRRMLELASAAPSLERYAHISTAYVAGTYDGVFTEVDLDLGQSFRNSYEQSKFEAEQLVRSRPEIPFEILRPSIVVGDRRNGWTSAFNVLYWPLRALSRGLLKEVPAVASAPVDVVSVDYVADAIYALRGPAVGETYHLTAGSDATTIQELAQAASRYFRRPAPKVTAPEEFVADSDTGRVYFPYFSVRSTFDDALARARLEPLGIRVSPLGDYLDRLLDFATLSRWGKRKIARFEAATA